MRLHPAPPLSNRTAKIALVHLARRQVGLPEDLYRALLVGAAGVHSAADLAREEDFLAVMAAFEKLGFRRGIAGAAPSAERWGCSAAQQRYIGALWSRYSRCKDRASLHAFIRRTTGLDSPQFLTRRRASEVIVGLERLAGEKPRRRQARRSRP